MFLIRGWRLYFPAGTLGCSVCLAPQLVYLHPNVEPPSPQSSTSPGPLHPPACHCPSYQINVSPLTPWLSDFHTVQFSVSSGFLFVCLFFNLLLSFFWLWEEAPCVYLYLHLGWKSLTQSILDITVRVSVKNRNYIVSLLLKTYRVLISLEVKIQVCEFFKVFEWSLSWVPCTEVLNLWNFPNYWSIFVIHGSPLGLSHLGLC